MTVHTLRPPSRMVELGQVITTYQKQRGYTDHAVCDFIGASEKLFGQWKAGVLVPDNQRWGRLCRMIHELKTFRQLWQDASNEQEAKDLASKPLAKLGDKFGSIKLVPPPAPPAPEPQPEPTPTPPLFRSEEVPDDTALVGGTKPPPGFNVGMLPKGWRSTEQVQAREDFAREYIRQHPEATNAEIREAQVAKFGMASAAKRMTEIKDDELAKVAKDKKRQEQKEARAADPYAAQRAAERKAAKAPPPAPKTPAELVAEAVAAASELLVDSIPNLASFTLTRDETGEVKVAYKTRVVVEDAGTITLGSKK